MSTDKLAFIIGLLGSVHCIAMCGPLAFAVPIHESGSWRLLGNKLLYQLGRVISYCLLGTLVGLIGGQIWEAGLQQGLSIATGLLITMAACSRMLKMETRSIKGYASLKWFGKAFNYALNHRANHLIIGLLNGLLPCGLVYLALAGALNTESVKSGVSYMFWFGMGTVPLMLIATISAGFINLRFRHKLQQLIPYAMLLLGAWFIIRGLELNIPYLSPKDVIDSGICK